MDSRSILLSNFTLQKYIMRATWNDELELLIKN